MEIEQMLKSVTADEQSIQVIAEYLEYSVGRNPNNPDSEWRMLFTNKIPDKTRAVLALLPVDGLTINTKTMEIRKLYKQVEELNISFGGSFDAEIAGFIGHRRIVLFRLKNGNRDERLDINEETINKPLYRDNFNMLKNSSITVEEDDFLGEYVINGLKDVFKRELTNHFLAMVALYRKKLSELITAKPYKEAFIPLVSENAKAFIMTNSLTQLVEDESYTAVLSNVVDTMILRQLMRRFIEAYYGKDELHPFELSGIALGVGRGTLDEAIKETVEIYANLSDETKINKLNRKKNTINQYEDYVEISLFDEDEYEATSKVVLKEDSKKRLIELHDKATKQFQTVYGGDLFVSSIGDVTTKIENLIVTHDAEMWAKFWIDTSSEYYSFRFEDVPPEALERQYENSMSQNVQIKIENGNPVVFYGEDLQEQKNKGAYYTDEKFVHYMVQQTVETEFQDRILTVKKAIETRDKLKIIDSLDYLFSMKIADLTAGGGSFLRGAFRQLADKHDALTGLKIPPSIKENYPMLYAGDEGNYAWEEYILHNMIYGVDIDYKAILISSLTLMLSSLQYRPADHKLPKLIGNTLIHQNSLMNSVPFYKRENIYARYQKEIKNILKLKREQSPKYEKKKSELQHTLLQYVQPTLNGETRFLNVEALEINLPEVFFEEDGKLKMNPGFDCVIGNPPWEIWKPNSDEFFSQYNTEYLLAKNRKEKAIIKEQIFNQLPSVKDKWTELEQRIKLGSIFFRDEDNFRFQSWKVEGRKTGSDINLYKISIERFLQLTTNSGLLSILTPDNLMTDLGSTGLRHLIFDNMQVVEFLSFENSKGIFPLVHRSYKFAVCTINKRKNNIPYFYSFFYRTMLSDLNNSVLKMKYPIWLIKEAEPEKYSLFEPRNQTEFDLYQKIKLSYPSLGNTKLFELRGDFHRTNDTSLFKDYNNHNDIPLYEGKLINQFRLVAQPTEGVSRSVVNTKTNGDYRFYRIGIRAVARETDRRALIATLLPRNSTAANSLLMQKNISDKDLENSLFFLGILNSYTLDFVLRKLITINVNQTYLKQLPIPRISEVGFSSEIVQIVKRLLMLNGYLYDELDSLIPGEDFCSLNYDELIAELNARVAIAYSLQRDELIELLKTFETVNHKKAVREEAQRIIEVYDSLKAGGIE